MDDSIVDDIIIRSNVDNIFPTQPFGADEWSLS